MNEHMFPDAHADGVEERVEDHWDLGYPLPMPKFHRACPRCVAADRRMAVERLVVKDWKFHQRNTKSKHPYRVDVRLKCVDCSIVYIFGVRVPEAYWRKGYAVHRSGGWINWREGKRLLAEAGFFEED